MLQHLAARGTAEQPNALDSHDLVLFAPAGGMTLAGEAGSHTARGRARLTVNNNWVATEMVAQNLGIAMLPAFQVARHPKRQHILPILAEWGRPPAPVHALVASRLYRPPKVETFIAVARRDFAQSVWL